MGELLASGDGKCPVYPRHKGVSKNKGTPKWMVKIMENPTKMDDLGGNPPFSETPINPKQPGSQTVVLRIAPSDVQEPNLEHRRS